MTTRRALMLAVVVALAVLSLLPSAHGQVRERKAGVEQGTLRSFDQTNVEVGSLEVTKATAYQGRRSVKASYDGGGGNGFSRGIFDLRWPRGTDVWYGAAFYLPRGFKSAMEGEVSLMRWDTHGSAEPGVLGGIAIWGSDKRARLKHGSYSGSETVLVGPFNVPEGRWFWLEVHQRLEKGGGGYSAVYLDGRRVGVSKRGNALGFPITRLRYGLVAIAEGAQDNPLSLYFDRAWISRRPLGPIWSKVRR